MKVVQHTANTLILRWISHLPWLNAAGTVILGLLVLSIGGQLTTFSCHRSASSDTSSQTGYCKLESRKLLASSTKMIPLDQIQRAKVHSDNKDSQIAQHRVLLVTSSMGSIALTPYFSSNYISQQNNVEKLELFLEGSDPEFLMIRDYGHSWVYFLGGMAITTGLVSASLGIERTTLTFDHQASCLQIHHERLFNSWTDEYNLNTITNVEIGRPPTTIPQFNTQMQKIKKASLPCLNILFESGNRLPLSLDPKAEPIKEVVRDIREFLQLSRNSVS